MKQVKVTVRPPLGWTIKFTTENDDSEEELHVFPTAEVVVDAPAHLEGDALNRYVQEYVEKDLSNALRISVSG
jgi:hypothetical protein